MAEDVAAAAGGLGLADAIAVLRDELLTARAAGVIWVRGSRAEFHELPDHH